MNSYIGKSVNRHDSYEKVTGSAVYVGDISLAGMLFGKFKTSPHAHANIISIDTAKARALPGVRAVITGKEASNKLGIYMVDRSIIAVDKVRYFGEVVAAVAADSLKIAEEAVCLIDVVYQELPPVLDVKAAFSPDSPLVHENMAGYKWIQGAYFPKPGTNIANHAKIRRGDPDKAFALADIVLENTFSQPQVFHAPLETHAVIATWGHKDRVKIHSSSQSPFSVRDLFAHAFGLPKANVEVSVPYIGGGFGCKSGIHLEPLTALLSKAAGGRPVKLVPSREEECSTLPCRQGLVAKIKTGITKDGRILAEEAEYLFDAGAYADYGVNISRAASITGCGPYNIENVKVDSYSIYTNHLFGTAYRGFGHPEVFFAIERQRDLLAKKIGMDPLAFRLKNLLATGNTTITGEIVTDNTGRVDLCLKKVADSIGLSAEYSQKDREAWEKAGKFRAKSATVLQKAPAMPTWSATSAVIKFNEDGTVLLSVGSIDMGQGTYTVLQQITAEMLNMPIERVYIAPEVNTNLSPYDWQTVASRMTVLCGNAVSEACEDLKDQLMEMATIVLRAARHEIEFGPECLYVKQNPHEKVSFQRLCMGYTYENGNAIGGPLIGRGRAIAQGLTNLDPETGQGRPALDWTYGAHGVEIEVDKKTGNIEILNLVTCMDVGRVMNEALLKGQVVGGVLQGLGTTFSEQLQYDDKGRLLTRNFVDYKIPTIKDMPAKTAVFSVETPQLDGPYGARGCGEHPLVGITALVANALSRATGIECFEMPLSADYVYRKLNEQ
ncbi:MAG: xanthine dehydrogenase family protein molybdopterin-binding subunit [Spirochaetes bacterium]|nr:xanthine dehydrogenase family protein molybdopterin-binding subunit [Spirochaetota bacterium]